MRLIPVMSGVVTSPNNKIKLVSPLSLDPIQGMLNQDTGRIHAYTGNAHDITELLVLGMHVLLGYGVAA